MHIDKQDGLFVEHQSGNPLFSSRDTFDGKLSGNLTFYKSIAPDNMQEIQESSLYLVLTEVRAKSTGLLLGYVYKDRLAPTGLRYCINPEAVRFIPKMMLEKEGYSEYLSIFQ